MVLPRRPLLAGMACVCRVVGRRPLVATLAISAVLAAGCADGGGGITLDVAPAPENPQPTPAGGPEPAPLDALVDVDFADSGHFEWTPGGGTEFGQAVLRDSVGRYLFAGRTGTVGTGVLGRLDAFGDLDDDFASTGIRQFGFTSPGDFSIDRLSTTNTDSVVLLGTRFVPSGSPTGSGTQSVRLWRVLPNGAFTTGFDESGRSLLTFSTDGPIDNAIEIGLDGIGRFFAVIQRPIGPDFEKFATVFRRAPSGDVDPNFGVSGRVTIEGPMGEPTNAGCALIPASGSIVVAGSLVEENAGSIREVVAIWWLDPDTGLVDALLTLPNLDARIGEFATAIVGDGSGGFYLAGNRQTSEPETVISGTDGLPVHDGFVVRIDAFGDIDPEFGVDGRATLNLSTSDGDRVDLVRAIALDHAGRLIAVGESWPAEWEPTSTSFIHGAPERTVWRLDATTGVLDPTFNDVGVGLLGAGSLAGVTADEDGIVVVGETGAPASLVVTRIVAR